MDEGITAGAFWADVPDDVALDRYRTLVNTVDDGIYQLDAEAGLPRSTISLSS